MLYLPKITVCKTMSEVILDTLSKLHVILSTVDICSFHCCIALLHYLPKDLWACGLRSALGILVFVKSSSSHFLLHLFPQKILK